jgi:hypothetical protein
MARIVFDTSAEDDAAIKRATDASNAERLARDPSAQVETPLQFVTRIWRHQIDYFVSVYRESQKLNRGELYQKATPTDQATIDAILAKYQTP